MLLAGMTCVTFRIALARGTVDCVKGQLELDGKVISNTCPKSNITVAGGRLFFVTPDGVMEIDPKKGAQAIAGTKQVSRLFSFGYGLVGVTKMSGLWWWSPEGSMTLKDSGNIAEQVLARGLIFAKNPWNCRIRIGKPIQGVKTTDIWCDGKPKTNLKGLFSILFNNSIKVTNSEDTLSPSDIDPELAHVDVDSIGVAPWGTVYSVLVPWVASIGTKGPYAWNSSHIIVVHPKGHALMVLTKQGFVPLARVKAVEMVSGADARHLVTSGIADNGVVIGKAYYQAPEMRIHGKALAVILPSSMATKSIPAFYEREIRSILNTISHKKTQKWKAVCKDHEIHILADGRQSRSFGACTGSVVACKDRLYVRRAGLIWAMDPIIGTLRPIRSFGEPGKMACTGGRLTIWWKGASGRIQAVYKDAVVSVKPGVQAPAKEQAIGNVVRLSELFSPAMPRGLQIKRFQCDTAGNNGKERYDLVFQLPSDLRDYEGYMYLVPVAEPISKLRLTSVERSAGPMRDTVSWQRFLTILNTGQVADLFNGVDVQCKKHRIHVSNSWSGSPGNGGSVKADLKTVNNAFKLVHSVTITSSNFKTFHISINWLKGKWSLNFLHGRTGKEFSLKGRVLRINPNKTLPSDIIKDYKVLTTTKRGQKRFQTPGSSHSSTHDLVNHILCRHKDCVLLVPTGKINFDDLAGYPQE